MTHNSTLAACAHAHIQNSPFTGEFRRVHTGLQDALLLALDRAGFHKRSVRLHAELLDLVAGSCSYHKASTWAASQEYIAERLRCSQRQVKRVLAELELAGILVVARGVGRGNRSHYRLNYAVLDQLFDGVFIPTTSYKRGHDDTLSSDDTLSILNETDKTISITPDAAPAAERGESPGARETKAPGKRKGHTMKLPLDVERLFNTWADIEGWKGKERGAAFGRVFNYVKRYSAGRVKLGLESAIREGGHSVNWLSNRLKNPAQYGTDTEYYFNEQTDRQPVIAGEGLAVLLNAERLAAAERAREHAAEKARELERTPPPAARDRRRDETALSELAAYYNRN